MRRFGRLLAALLAPLLATVVCLPTAVAAPDAPPAATLAPQATPDATLGPSSAANVLPPAALAPIDAVMRLLADKGLVQPAEPGSAQERPAADAAASANAAHSRFVDRFRDKASDMVLTAMNFIGTPYRRGGNNADHGFDCSGFTRHVFEMSLGLVLPRRADEQATTAGLLRIDREQLRPGDLVFFNTMRRTFSHVGIYVGAGKFIHSPKPGGEVRVDDLQAGYWDKRFTGGRRAEPAAGTAADAGHGTAPAAQQVN